jgi:hypothetical protein
MLRRAVIALLLAWVACACAEAPPAPARAAKPHAARAYVDPETGELGAPPSQREPGVAAGGGAGDEALEIVPGRTRAGGVMVDLRGRFSYGLRAAVSDDGKLTAACGARDGHRTD